MESYKLSDLDSTLIDEIYVALKGAMLNAYGKLQVTKEEFCKAVGNDFVQGAKAKVRKFYEGLMDVELDGSVDDLYEVYKGRVL